MKKSAEKKMQTMLISCSEVNQFTVQTKSIQEVKKNKRRKGRIIGESEHHQRSHRGKKRIISSLHQITLNVYTLHPLEDISYKNGTPQ